MPELQYVPLRITETEAILARRCLRKFVLREKRKGNIPAWTSQAEIDSFIDDHVYSLLSALHSDPHYQEIRGTKNRIEAFLQSIIETHFLNAV
jgi:hypothetical protein